MTPITRRLQLLDELASSVGRVRVDMLADHFHVSERTIRYDLRFLETRGVRFDVKSGKTGGIRLESVPDDLRLRIDRVNLSSRKFGYSTESAALDRLLSASRNGRGAIAVVTGEAGTGKTRLCRGAAEKARHIGFDVHSFSAQESRVSVPLEPWVGLINHLISRRSHNGTALSVKSAIRLDALAHSLPEIHFGVPSELKSSEEIPRNSTQLIDAMAELIVDLADEEPILFFFDDIQWSDAQSLELLLALSDRCHSAHMLIMATARTPVPPSSPSVLSGLVSKREIGLGISSIELQGLSYIESGQLLTTLTSIPEGDGLFDEIIRVSRGNPLFIRELGLHNSRMGSDGDSVEIPTTIDEAIAERLAPLSPTCHATLSSASILGSEFSIELLQAITDLKGEDILRPLAEALAYQVIECVDPARMTYRFSHPIVYRHVYSSIAVAEREVQHGKIAGFLLNTRQSDNARGLAETLHHLQQSGSNSESSQVAELAIELAEIELESFTFKSAADHFQLAIDLSHDKATYGRACKGMALASSGIDDLTGVQKWNREAITALLEAGDLVRAVEASQIGGSLADPQASLELARLVLNKIPDSFPGRASPLSTYGWMQGWVEDEYNYKAACGYLREAIKLAESEGDDSVKCLAMGRLAQIKFLNLDMAGCMKLALEGLDHAKRLSHPERESHFLIYAIEVSLELGDLETAESYIAITHDAAQRSGSAFRIRGANWVDASLRHATNRGMSTEQLYQETSRDMAQLPLASLAVSAAERLDSESTETLGLFRRSLPFTVRSTSQNATTPEVLTAVASVFEDSSLLRFDRPLSLFGVLPNDSPIALRNRLIATGLSAAIDGDVEGSRWAYQQLVASQLVAEPHRRSAPLEQALGMVAAGSNSYHQAFDHFTAAITKAQKSGYLPTMAWSLVQGFRSAVRGNLRSEASSFAGWIPSVRSFISKQRLELISRKLGEAVAGVEKTWPSALVSDSGLTTREMEVLRLVADGQTNEQIGYSLGISASTVASHIKSILSKTNSRNRVDLAVLVHAGKISIRNL